MLKRIDFASDILAKHRVMIAGMPPLTREETIRKVSFFDAYGEVCIYLLPFVKPSYVRNLNDSDITTYNEAVRLVIERENIDTAKAQYPRKPSVLYCCGQGAGDVRLRDPHGWRD